MSNPTLATKLVTLVKGIFGRNETVPASEDAAKETAETTAAPTAPERTRDEAPAEKTEEAAKAEKAEAAAPAETAPAEAETKEAPAAKPEKDGAVKSEPVEAAALVETAPAEEPDEAAEGGRAAEEGPEPRTEPATPATADISEEGPAIAEELEVAEAHTKVASDEVLEKVRKGAAPSAEELAVPTYDELTLPSVRARLRKLTVEQVRDLRAYEVAHQGRPEFIKMYDNRINKLEAGA